MVAFFVRAVLTLLGVLLLADAFQPVQIEEAQVTRKTVTFNLEALNIPGARIYLEGVTRRPCHFDLFTYARLEVGDTVSVSRSGLTGTCVGISRGNEVIESPKLWKPLLFLFGAIVLYIAIFGRINISSSANSTFEI